MTPADTTLPNLSTWTDLSGFGRLRAQAEGDARGALPAVARQFESIFTQMVLKSMREANASLGEDPMGSQAGEAWRGLFDQQLSLTLSQTGHGLGIAQMLVRQLGGAAQAAAAAEPATATAHAGAGAGPAAGGRAAAAGGLPASAAEFRRRVHDMVEAGKAVGDSVGRWLPKTPTEFVRALAPYAQTAARQLGVSVRAVLAQAALETQWGRHMPRTAEGGSSFNLFGIKAGRHWNGDKVSVPTLEYEDGVAVRRHAHFRAYASPADSFRDFARLVRGNPDLAAACGHGEDVHGFASALAAGGYATDPAYAAKITAIANGDTMREALASLKNPAGLPTD